MGSKGKDAALWLFLVLMLVSIPFRSETAKTVIFTSLLLLASVYLYYCARYLPGAVKRSRDLGIEMVVLLPVYDFWATFLLRFDKRRMNTFRGVYEVHIKSGKQSLSGFLQVLASDLEIAEHAFPGALFMWETSTPLPLTIRRMIREATPGTAFLKQGCWPVPIFPFTGRRLNKDHVRHGAIIARESLNHLGE